MKLIKNIVLLLNREMPIEILKKRGMKVGKNFSKQQGCFIDPSHCFLIEIGNDVTFSIRVTLLAHDASCKDLIHFAKIGRIIIGDNVFIGANVTVLPNVTIGNNSIIGAGSIVTHDIPPNSVAVGNPAKIISTTEEYKMKLEKQLENSKTFSEDYTIRKKVDKIKKNELKDSTDKYGICFIK